MPFQQWQLAFVLGLALSHAAMAVVYYWLRRNPASTANDVRLADNVTSAPTDEFLATCPECGTENELGYRYCRNCVSELPGAVDFGSDSDVPVGRLIR